MSKKNNLGTRKNRHKADLEREKAAAIAKQKKQEKKQRKQHGSEADNKLAAASSKIAKGKKSQRRGFRIKKGVTIKGVKITDSASKKKALQLLAAEQALREMDVDLPAKNSKPSKIADAASMDVE